MGGDLMNIVTLIILAPLLGTLVLAAVPQSNSRLVKIITLTTSLLTAAISIAMALKYQPAKD